MILSLAIVIAMAYFYIGWAWTIYKRTRVRPPRPQNLTPLEFERRLHMYYRFNNMRSAGLSLSLPRINLPRRRKFDPGNPEAPLPPPLPLFEMAPLNSSRLLANPLSKEEIVEKGPNEMVIAEDIREVTNLLRRMYGVELELYGMRDAIDVTPAERAHLIRESNGIVAEIRETTARWSANGGAAWTEDERQRIEYILSYLQSMST